MASLGLVLVLLCLSLTRYEAAYTEFYQRCLTSYTKNESLRNRTDCARGQTVDCDALYIPYFHPTTVCDARDCAPAPQDLKVTFYQEARYMDGTAVYTGANMSWTISGEGTAWTNLVGFYLRITIDIRDTLTYYPRYLTVNITQHDFVDGKVTFHYDCGYPLHNDVTGNFTVTSVSRNDAGAEVITSHLYVTKYISFPPIPVTTSATTTTPALTTSTSGSRHHTDSPAPDDVGNTASLSTPDDHAGHTSVPDDRPRTQTKAAPLPGIQSPSKTAKTGTEPDTAWRYIAIAIGVAVGTAVVSAGLAAYCIKVRRKRTGDGSSRKDPEVTVRTRSLSKLNTNHNYAGRTDIHLPPAVPEIPGMTAVKMILLVYTKTSESHVTVCEELGRVLSEIFQCEVTLIHNLEVTHIQTSAETVELEMNLADIVIFVSSVQLTETAHQVAVPDQKVGDCDVLRIVLGLVKRDLQQQDNPRSYRFVTVVFTTSHQAPLSPTKHLSLWEPFPLPQQINKLVRFLHEHNFKPHSEMDYAQYILSPDTDPSLMSLTEHSYRSGIACAVGRFNTLLTPVGNNVDPCIPLNNTSLDSTRHYSQPGHMQPGHSQPGHMQPAGECIRTTPTIDSTSSHSQPGHSQPGHMQPGHMQPGHMQPGHMQPAGECIWTTPTNFHPNLQPIIPQPGPHPTDNYIPMETSNPSSGYNSGESFPSSVTSDPLPSQCSCVPVYLPRRLSLAPTDFSEALNAINMANEPTEDVPSAYTTAASHDFPCVHYYKGAHGLVQCNHSQYDSSA